MRQGRRIFKDRWKCFNCQYPRCSRCDARPEFAGPSHTCYTKDGKYMCANCRYPPCTGCGKERPKKGKYSVERIPLWRCPSCPLAGQNCITHTWQGRCHRQLPAHAFDKDAKRRRYAVCKECQHPACATCGQKSTEIWTPNPKMPNEVYKCSACEKSKPAGKQPKKCKTCEETDASAFDSRDEYRHLYDRCRNCQHPKCSECGHESAKIWTPHPKIPNQVYRCTACVKRETKNHL